MWTRFHSIVRQDSAGSISYYKVYPGNLAPCDFLFYSDCMLTAGLTARENEVLETAVSILKKELDPQRIILFGSCAERHHDPGSDFDLAIDAVPPARAYQIRETVNDSVGLYAIDIVYLPNIDSDFRNLILRTGKVIYERKA